jgi:hypothetical protein
MAKVKLPKTDSMADFELKDDMRTLKKAKEIMSDSKRMARVKSMAREEAGALMEIASGKGLRRMK